MLGRADRVAALRGSSRGPCLRCRVKENLALGVREYHGANIATGKYRPSTGRHASLNSFVETRLLSLTRGEVMHWRPMRGARAVL